MACQPSLRQAFSIPTDSTTLCALWHNIKTEQRAMYQVMGMLHQDILCLAFCSEQLRGIPWANTSIYKQWNDYINRTSLILPDHRIESCWNGATGWPMVMLLCKMSAASNGAVRVLGLTNTNTSTNTTSVCRICINTCVLCSSRNHSGLKFPKKKSTKFQSACTIRFSHTKNLRPPGNTPFSK
jgi:hypothetical protein